MLAAHVSDDGISLAHVWHPAQNFLACGIFFYF